MPSETSSTGSVMGFFEKIWGIIVQTNVLNIIGALLILLAGWIVAVVVSKLISKGLQKLGLGKSLSVCLPEDEVKKASVAEKFISGVVYYLILLFTVLAALSALKLTEVVQPLQNLVDNITGYLGNILAAVALLFIAWVVATALRYFSQTAMHAFKLDEKVSKHVDSQGKETNLSYSVSTVIYWITFLFFAPSILGALEIKNITDSLTKMFDKVLIYLPNVIAAVGIAVVGLFFANIVRKVVTTALTALNIDVVGEKAGVAKVFEQRSLSKLIGFISYTLIAIPVLIASLNVLNIHQLSNSLGTFLDKVLDASGNLIGAALVVFVCYIVGSLVAGIIVQLLEDFGFNKLMGTFGWNGNTEKGVTPSKVIGKLIFISIIYLSMIIACDIMAFTTLSNLLSSFIPFAGNLLLGIAIFMVGIFLANLASDAIRNKGFESQILTILIKIVVLLFAGAIALHRMDIGGEIVMIAFAGILACIGLGLGVAFAIAFGLGGKEFAAKKLNEWDEKFSKKD